MTVSSQRLVSIAVLLLLAASTARAELQFGARAEGHAAFALSSPQSTYFGPGAALTATGLLSPFSMLDIEAMISWLTLTANASSGLGRSGEVLSFGAGVRFKRAMDGNFIVPYGELAVGLAGSGTATLNVAPAVGVLLRWSTALPLWIGLSARFQQLFHITDVPGADGYHASMLTVGLAIEFHQQTIDTDGDGVPDSRDRCLTDAAHTDDGCPARVADQDNDGIPDQLDACATEAEDRDGHDDVDGCPDLDDDGDGVPDDQDECKTTKGSAEAKGCPDSDSDGVPDNLDMCPKKAGVKEEEGCPRHSEAVKVTKTKIEINEKLFFAFGSTKLLPKSEPILDQVASVLTDRELLCVRIEGHTDKKGGEDANRILSEGRASEVKAYLVSRGVAARRLTAKGYGSSIPRDDNSTAEGRDNNRRVEFTITSCLETESAR